MASGFGTQLVSALAFNVCLRLFTFFLSTWLTRTLLPAQVGINFSYLVYVESIHFLSREAIKNVSARYSVSVKKEESEHTHKGTRSTGHGGFSMKVDCQKLIALLNTAALTIPACVLVMASVEVLGAVLFPGGVALWNAITASPSAHGKAVNLFHNLTSASAGVAGRTTVESVVILPSLAGPMFRAWKSAWRLATESLSYESTSGVLKGTISLSFWWPLLFTCARLAIPEILAWTSVVGLALVDPSVALLTSMDLFRTIVIAEGTTMMVRLGFTLFLTKALLSPGDGSAGAAAPLHRFVDNHTPPLVAGIENSRYMEAHHAMEHVNKEWLVRLVFASGCIVHSAAMILFYAIACGSGLRKLRWWLGTAHWCPPPVSPPLLVLLRGKTKSEKAMDLLFDEVGTFVYEEEEEDVEREKCEKDAVKVLNGNPEGMHIAKKPFLSFLFPLLVPYVRWSAMRGALRHHRLLLTAFFRESLIRLALSEGTNIALLSVSDAASRGCYQTISRLGALATRLLFRIWENACQAHWSRLAHQGEAQEAVHGLRVMLRLSLYVGFLCSWLGPLYARLVLTVLYSGRWTTVGMVGSLQYYCHTMGPMAWNGLLECFVRAVAHPSLLKQQQVWTVVISIIYVVSSYVVLLQLRHKQDLTQQEEWNQLVHTYENNQTHLGNSPLNADGIKLKSIQAIERCEDTTVTDALLVLHRINMIVRIFISIGLLLWCKNTAPQSAEPSACAGSNSKKDEQDRAKQECREAKESVEPTKISDSVSGQVVSWSDLIAIFPFSTAPALVGLFIWTRTPALFPEYLLSKLYMPPLLTFLFVVVVIGLDTGMRNALLRFVTKYRGRRNIK